MKNKVLAAILTASMVTGLLAGCGVSTSSAPAEGAAEASTAESGAEGAADAAADSTAAADTGDKPYSGVTLTLWGAGAEIADNDGTQKLLAKATEELGMTFEVETNPTGTEGDNIIKTRCASGDLPDLVDYNSGSLFTALNPKEHFLDITDEPMTANFDEAFKSCVSQEGRVYGAPFTTTQAGAVVYWKPDYEELGLSVPKTWDEFLANCDALEKAGKTAVYMSGGDTWTTQVLFLGDNYNVNAANPNFAQEFTEGKAKFATTPAALAGWKKYEDLVGRYNADSSAAKYEDGCEAMAKGEATHWFILTQAIASMIQNHPECKENIGVFGVPGDDANNAGLTVWEPNGWYINKDSANIEAAKAFLEFWTSPENLDIYIETFGANGPSCIKGYTLPESVCPAIREDMQSFFDDNKTCPALEYQTSIKGATCEQITTSAATGQISGEEAAKMYDDDCKKSAVQQGFNWQ
ncbi:MAG: carbohydrate ABC transporter substrate-binding protein [Lachnospiraceae bacterium]|nr:carbohydrate ABC transporter substrate-binding protein [Lachnospiraceae bacterium]